MCAKKLPSTSERVNEKQPGRPKISFLFFVFFFALAEKRQKYRFSANFFSMNSLFFVFTKHTTTTIIRKQYILSNKKKRCSSCAATSVAPVVGTALPALLRALPICFWSPPPPPPPRFRREERRFDETTTTTTTDAVFQLTDTNARAQSLGGTAQPSEEE